MKNIDFRSFVIGILSTLLVVVTAGAGYEVFSEQEVSRLKKLATYIQDDGNLNLGNRKIIMLGSSIFDDGSQGGGLQIIGGANSIHLMGDSIFHQSLQFKRDTVDFSANLNMGNKKIIMLGSQIFDNGSEGGGLQIKGGANRIHLFGQTLPH